jgi:4-hydroxy-tetrahydrodipicolinate reductase
MGRQIASLALADGAFRLAAALEAPGHPEAGRDYGRAIGRDLLGVTVGSDLGGGIDVLVDFSAVSAARGWAAACSRLRIPFVIGTTGLDAAARKAVKAAARRVAVVSAPNMSVGVNALLRALPELVRLLGPAYDLEIVEAHHRLKRDAPSGTALALAEAVARAAGVDLGREAVYGRRGLTGVRPDRQIGLHAVRAGDIVGDHRVLFAGPGESIEVTHRAHSRETFATGALRAARFAAGARPGLYSMVDVLRHG